MPPSSIVVGGRRTRQPGAYSEMDASALARRGPGIIQLAILGTAEGGVPVSVQTAGRPTFGTATSPDQVRSLFRSGGLRTAGLLAFNATADADIRNAPSRVLFGKVNPATQSGVDVIGGGAAVARVTSRDYGAFTSRISLALSPGTNKGYLVALALEATLEGADDVGGDIILRVRYDEGGDADTMALTVDADGVRARATKAIAADPAAAAFDAGERATLVSASAYDTHIRATVFGVDTDDVPIRETVRLNGLTPVLTELTFKKVTGVLLSGAPRGAVTVADESAHTVFTVAAVLAGEHASGEHARVVSTSVDDIGQTATLYGLDSVLRPVVDRVVLNGDTIVESTKTFHRLLAVVLDSACAGTLSVTDESAHTSFTLAAGVLSKGVNVQDGLFIPTSLSASGALSLSQDIAAVGTPFVVVRGVSQAGAETAERVVIGLVEVDTDTLWRRVDSIELGGMQAGSELALAGLAVDLPVATYDTVAKVVEELSSLPGWYAEALCDGPDTFTSGRLDFVAAANVKSANWSALYADLDAVGVWVNANSQLASWARLAGAGTPPDYTPAPRFLSGGSEGTATAAHWQAAFDALKGRRDVVVVALSTSPAIHAMHAAHNRFMEGAGRDERNGYVGVPGTTTKAELAALIRALGDRNLSLVSQYPTVYDEAGVATELGPEYLAVMAGAMQCGAAVGWNLTAKRPNLVSVRSHTSWSPELDAEEMLEMGLLFVAPDDRLGLTWKRGITTWRADDNPIFTEIGANWSANESTKRWRHNLELKIGQPNFDGTASTVKTLSVAELQTQVEEGIIRTFDAQSIDARDFGDGYEVEGAVNPLETINFIKLTTHLARLSSAA